MYSEDNAHIDIAHIENLQQIAEMIIHFGDQYNSKSKVAIFLLLEVL